MEKIEQRHRDDAAAKIKGAAPKDGQVRRDILAGRSDHHPLVQGAAFYEGTTHAR